MGFLANFSVGERANVPKSRSLKHTNENRKGRAFKVLNVRTWLSINDNDSSCSDNAQRWNIFRFRSRESDGHHGKGDNRVICLRDEVYENTVIFFVL